MSGKKILIFGIIALVGIVFIWNAVNSPKDNPPPTPKSPTSQDDSPRIVSTKPDPLEGNIVGATDTIEITFNKSLENSGEFKLRIEPKVDFKIELINERKTAKISFPKSLDLGVTYTIFIGPDTKFDGVGNWGKEKIFHFRTIKYTGV